MFQQAPSQQPGPNGMPEVAYPNPPAGNGHIQQAGPHGVGGVPPAPPNLTSPVYTFVGNPHIMVLQSGGVTVSIIELILSFHSVLLFFGMFSCCYEHLSQFSRLCQEQFFHQSVSSRLNFTHVLLPISEFLDASEEPSVLSGRTGPL